VSSVGILRRKVTEMKTIRWLMLGAALASVGSGSVITETEANGAATNNTLATAQAIPYSAFTQPATGVFNNALFGVTIQGKGGGQDVDFYSFFAGGPLQLSITDTPFTFPTILSLFDSTGKLLAFDDVSTPAKPGSASTLDSYINYLLPSFGTYYVAVSSAGASIPNYPDTSSCTSFNPLTRPDGGTAGLATGGCDSSSSVFAFGGAQPSSGALSYTLQIAQAPEPGTTGLMLLGAAGLFARMRSMRNRQAGAAKKEAK
jgi:hypothetical protein